MTVSKSNFMRRAAVAVALIATTNMANATDLVRVMKVVPQAFQLTVVDVGVEKGIFAKYDLELDITGSSGGAKLQQSLAADAADIGLGTGPELGFIAKGAPSMAVAATHGAPLNLGIVVSADSKFYPADKTIDDMKGAKVGVATPSSQTFYLVRRISIEKGWGPEGMIPVPLGSVSAQMAAMKTGNIDAMMNSTDIGYGMEARGAGRTIVKAGDYLADYHAHIIYASNKFRAAHPDVLRRFLAAYFETVALIKADKSIMVKTGARVLEMPEAILNRAYDEQVAMIKDDGKFDDAAMAEIAQGLVDTQIMDSIPDMKTLYTEEYLPK